MERRRDKLGEYVMIGEELNRYEEFAAAAENYATVDEANPTTPGPGTFDLYRDKLNTLSNERRVLIHSDHIYGKRRPIARLLFDIPCAVSQWQRTCVANVPAGPNPGFLYGNLSVKVKPIREDFEPATIDWDDAAALSCGDELTIDFAGEFPTPGTLTINWDFPADPPHHATATLTELLQVPGLLVTKCVDINDPTQGCPVAGWNAEDAIYGWMISVETDNCGVDIRWQSGSLDAPWARCFVIRK